MLRELLKSRPWLLADGATGTNYFSMGLGPGDPPELWNVENAENVRDLHRRFIDAGADIILTNTFGGTSFRLKLHQLENRVRELNAAGVRNAKLEAENSNRPVIVAGSVGPTGELLEPVGSVTFEEAKAAFIEQIDAMAEAGADVAWIETMSSIDEIRAAAEAASSVGIDYVFTASFDTAGKTMMGLAPEDLPSIVADFSTPPTAMGANCGVGASDLLYAIGKMTKVSPSLNFIAKANCGIPQIQGENVVYSGSPDLMARYAQLAIDSGARIIGGCCGTSPEHLAAMRVALEDHSQLDHPSLEKIVSELGPIVNPPSSKQKAPRRERRGRRHAG